MSYLNTNSILNRLDPRIKMVMTVALMIGIFFVSNWLVLGLFLALVGGLVLLARIPASYCLKKLKSPTLMIVVMLILQLLMAPGKDVIFEVGFLRITAGAILHGLLVFIRLMIVLMSAIVLTSTTMPKEFILAMESFLLPVKKIGLRTGAVMLIFRMIQRFVPSIFEEANKILKAQASRGLDIKGATLWMKMRLVGALLLPVFVVAIRRADDLASCMAVRGYVMNQERTNYQRLRKG